MKKEQEAMDVIQLSQRAQTWTEQQEVLARASAELFDASIGAEATIFAEAMALVHGCFAEEVLSSISGGQQKISLAILSQAYQQLVSCWQDIRQGRIASAANHWRSIWEAHEFAMAAAANADFAKEWADPKRRGTLKPQAARRIVKGWFESSASGAGAAWAKGRFQNEPMFQPLSHVSSVAAAQTALKPDPGAKGYFLMPEGFFSSRSRMAAIQTADLARQLAAAAWLCLDGLLPSSWDADFHEMFDRGYTILHEPEASEVSKE